MTNYELASSMKEEYSYVTGSIKEVMEEQKNFQESMANITETIKESVESANDFLREKLLECFKKINLSSQSTEKSIQSEEEMIRKIRDEFEQTFNELKQIESLSNSMDTAADTSVKTMRKQANDIISLVDSLKKIHEVSNELNQKFV